MTVNKGEYEVLGGFTLKIIEFYTPTFAICIPKSSGIY